MAKKRPECKKCDCIMVIAAVFFLIAVFKLLTLNLGNEDPYIFTFTWLLVAFVFLAIVIYRYFNLQQKC